MATKWFMFPVVVLFILFGFRTASTRLLQVKNELELVRELNATGSKVDAKSTTSQNTRRTATATATGSLRSADRSTDRTKYTAGRNVSATDRTRIWADKKRTSAQSYEDMRVLVAVVSSRASMNTRAKTIINTWAKTIPERVSLRFFVGSANSTSGFESGSPEDIAHLAKAAGTQDHSLIHVMTEVDDDEYPPVLKNTAMIKHLNDIAEQQVDKPYKWILKVDDDAYVHFRGLFMFLKTRDPTVAGYFGERGLGRPSDRNGLARGGLTGPFCMGGSGYVLSRSALNKTASNMDQCLSYADNSKYRENLWHSDTLIGLCVQQSAGINCFSDQDYLKHRVFRHNYKKNIGSNFLPNVALRSVAVVHPFKDQKTMTELHDRFQRVVPSKAYKTLA